MKKLFTLTLAGILMPVGTSSAQVKDLATLFPSNTKAYLEFNQIDQVVKEIRPLLKGSVLEDMPGSLEKIRAKLDDEHYYMRMMEILVFITPEGIAELSRMKGGAVAITDMPKDIENKDPEIVAVLLTGESNLPAMFLRGLLTMDRFQKVSEVEGVKIYRNRYRIYNKPNFEGKEIPPQPAKPEYREQGPAIAMVAGAIVFGSTTSGVSDVVKRMKGKGADSLAQVADFKKAAAQRQQPGLFLYSELESLTGLFSYMTRPYSRKAMGNVRPPDPDSKEAFKEEPKAKAPETPIGNLVASMKAFKTISAQLTLKDGVLEMRGDISFDAKIPSGWPDFFTARTVDLNMFQYAPATTRAVYSLPLPDGEQFWNKLGKMAPTFETNLSLTLGSGALDKITHMAMIDVASPDSKSKQQGPIWLMQTKDAAAASALAKDLAVNLKMSAIAKGNAVALGMDRALVDLVLATGAAKKGLLSQTKNATALKSHDKAHLVLAWSMGQSMIDQLKSNAERVRNFRDRPDFKDKFEKLEIQEEAQQPNPDSPQQRYAKKLDQLAEELTKAIEPLPPLVVSLTKKDNHLVVNARQTNLQTAFTRLLDGWVEWNMYNSVYGHRFNRMDFRESKTAVPNDTATPPAK